MGKKQTVYGNCWIAYFDILGFKKLISKYKGHIDCFARGIYDEILEEIKKRSERVSEALNKNVNYAWFSDSFLFFTEDDTYASYSSIDIVLWEYFQKMMFKGYSLRGALAVGEFYANKDRHTYIGPALIEAYSYAEKQKWIGLVLTPEAGKKLSEPGYVINKINYSEYEVPIKSEKIKKEKLFARNIRSLEKYIIRMQNTAKVEEEYEKKLKVIYENTLEFIKHLKSQGIE
ncbi:MAG: hypothetical protein FVQ85_18935 [Planctomycetes bacterium]|nr:hypothetical protein [Planctomycetota bacterium]